MRNNASLLMVSCDAARVGYGGKEAYAHPTARGMMLRDDRTHPYTYADMRDWHNWDDNSHICNFRLASQVDHRDDTGAMPYGIEYGYQTSHAMLTIEDIRQHGKNLESLHRALDRMEKADGAPQSFGVLILRLARALKVDAIVLMPERPWSDDIAPLSVWTLQGERPGDSIWRIDRMVRLAREACKQLTGQDADSVAA